MQQEVVYKTPLSCGNIHIGQTGQCFIDRVRQHAYNVKNGYGSHMAVHCKDCKQNPLFYKTRFLKKARAKKEREIIEEFFARKAAGLCISTPSLHLSDRVFIPQSTMLCIITHVLLRMRTVLAPCIKAAGITSINSAESQRSVPIIFLFLHLLRCTSYIHYSR